MAKPVGPSVLRERFDQQFLARPAKDLDELFGRLIAFQAQSDQASSKSIEIRLNPDRWSCQAVRTWSLRGTLNYTSVAEASDLVLVTRNRNLREVRRVLGNHGLAWRDAREMADHLAEYLQGKAHAVSRLELRDVAGTNFTSSELDAAFSSWGGIMKLVATLGLVDVRPGADRVTQFRWLADLPRDDTTNPLERIGQGLWMRFSAAYGPCRHSDFARWLGLGITDLKGITSDEATTIPQTLASESSESICVVLPEFDPYIVSSACRGLLFSTPEVSGGVVRRGGWLASTIVVDGLVVGFAAPNTYRRKSLFLVDPEFLSVVSDHIGNNDLYNIQSLPSVT